MKIEKIRHSLAHILAAAVKRLYPEVKIGMGPAIDNGFYYDFDFKQNINENDLKKIEKEMRKIIKEKQTFKQEKVSVDKAREIFQNQPYKLEIIDDIDDDKINLYKNGDFVDVCRGPHIDSTSEIKPDSFVLDRLAGAYWKGDEKNKMLQRVYGLAFKNKKALADFIEKRKEARERDHKKLGKELDLFVFSEIVGPGLPLFTPKGKRVLDKIKNYSRELRKEMGYQEVQTPQINKDDLFKTSGHYDKYKDDMLSVQSHYTDEKYFLKPMNCPQHTQIYASKLRSYRDLPVRYSDLSLLYRDEKPGELSGLARLRCFSQDDGHSFCREDQIKSEFNRIINGVNKALKTYDLDYYIRFSTWDEDDKDSYLGDKSLWKKSQKKLRDLIEEKDVEFKIGKGEAAFYGPKVDFMAKDSLGREWQISTIQLDFNMPQRFDLEYVDENGDRQTPVMVHAAIIGSPERFFGILIEHYAGNFPAWLAPQPVVIIPISDNNYEYVDGILENLEKHNIFASIDKSDNTLGKKIRNAETNKIPYILVVGDKEMDKNKVNVRFRHKKETALIDKDKFVEKITEKINNRDKALEL